MEEVMRGGRAKWRIENETFNTLKNQGYNFEHNFGHGNKNLYSIMAMLLMLAFFVDQICELLDEKAEYSEHPYCYDRYRPMGFKISIYEKGKDINSTAMELRMDVGDSTNNGLKKLEKYKSSETDPTKIDFLKELEKKATRDNLSYLEWISINFSYQSQYQGKGLTYPTICTALKILKNVFKKKYVYLDNATEPPRIDLYSKMGFVMMKDERYNYGNIDTILSNERCKS